jgi:uncharacterized protein (DUF2267 family)
LDKSSITQTQFTRGALAATQAMLEDLAERLSGNEPEHLTAQLPEELACFLRQRDRGQRFSTDEFFERVSDRTSADLSDAVYQVRVVFEILGEVVGQGEINDVLAQLPDDYRRILSPAGRINA